MPSSQLPHSQTPTSSVLSPLERSSSSSQYSTNRFLCTHLPVLLSHCRSMSLSLCIEGQPLHLHYPLFLPKTCSFVCFLSVLDFTFFLLSPHSQHINMFKRLLILKKSHKIGAASSNPAQVTVSLLPIPANLL